MASYNKVDIQLGDVVSLMNHHLSGQRGIVEFVGNIYSGTAVGLNMDDPVGSNNGSLAGHFYFTCAANHGLFVGADQVSLIGRQDNPASAAGLINFQQLEKVLHGPVQKPSLMVDQLLLARLECVAGGPEYRAAGGIVVPRAERYKIERHTTGLALIFINSSFTIKDADPRTGSEKDIDPLEEMLRNLGFLNLHTYRDTTASKMKRLLLLHVKVDHTTDSHALLIAISSHSYPDGAIAATDGPVTVEEILSPFRGATCESFKGKPKLLILAACHGEKLDSGLVIESDSPGKMTRIAEESDVLIARASPPGYHANLSALRGTWFLNSICAAAKEYHQLPETNLMDLLTSANFMPSRDFETQVHKKQREPPFVVSDPDLSEKKQVGYISSTLTKRLTFPNRFK